MIDKPLQKRVELFNTSVNVQKLVLMHTEHLFRLVDPS